MSTAVSTADDANRTVNKLAESSQQIGQVARVIAAIAEQTNLLALNASIEAARAGEMGKGFAVVAGEVKDLAAETARATENISRQIASPQADSTDAGMAIGGISTTVNQIACAVEDQSTATGGISDRVDQATGGTTEIARRVETLTGTSRETSTAAGQTMQAAEDSRPPRRASKRW